MDVIDISPLGQSAEFDADVASTPSLGAQSSFGDVFAASVDRATLEGPSASLDRMAARNRFGAPPSDVLTAEQANQQYGVLGATPETSLQWKPGETVRTDTAATTADLFHRRSQDQLIASQGPGSFLGGTAALGGDLIGSALDPINLAASFVPASWFGRGAELALRASNLTTAAEAAGRLTSMAQETAWGRTAASAFQNAGAVALAQPILMAGAQEDHIDYSFGDAAQNILFGGLIGGAIHGGGEILGGIARSTVRAAAAQEASGALSPVLLRDLASTNRDAVVDDLTNQNGVPPTDDQIQTETLARQQAIHEKAVAGAYNPDPAPPEEAALPGNADDELGTALHAEDYGTAAAILKRQTDELGADPFSAVSEADQAEAAAPVQKAAQVKQALQDFTACVVAEMGA